jgi:hypothetical protein
MKRDQFIVRCTKDLLQRKKMTTNSEYAALIAKTDPSGFLDPGPTRIGAI